MEQFWKKLVPLSGIPFTTFELTFDLKSIQPEETIREYQIEIDSKLKGQGILLEKIKKAQAEIVNFMEIAKSNLNEYQSGLKNDSYK